MSTEKGEGKSTYIAAPETNHPSEITTSTPQTNALERHPTQQPVTPPSLTEERGISHDRKPPAKRDQASESTSPSTPEDAARSGGETSSTIRPRQVIAVSASKGPAAFFNLARKFLVTDEVCDLSALEGAIVSAVDAAHLLERSKLATIVRVQTSYVSVEPKRRKSHQQHGTSSGSSSPAVDEAAGHFSPADTMVEHGTSPASTSRGRELRRARIVITVKRTESYEQWLKDNPLQAIIAGDGGDDDEQDPDVAVEGGGRRRGTTS